MSDARHEILERIRRATRDLAAAEVTTTTNASADEGSPSRGEVLDLFSENVADYRATVHRVAAEMVAVTLVDELSAAGASTLLVPEGLEASWLAALPAGIATVPDRDLTATQLDQVAAVVTSATVGIARTGTIVLDHGPGQGRRALTLVPDTHVCVIGADQVVDDVPEAIGRLSRSVPRSPLTWISGPSATSDIELDRVEGVHGPRRLVVILIDG